MKVGRTIFPSRPSTTRKKLPRQPAEASGAATLGFLGPFPSYTGTTPFIAQMPPHAVSRVPPFCGSWAAFSLGCQPGSFESASCVTWSVLGSPPLRSFHRCPGGRRPLTHSPRREVVSGPAHTRGAHPTASGRLEEVVLFRQSYPALTNGGDDNAVVPCGT